MVRLIFVFFISLIFAKHGIIFIHETDPRDIEEIKSERNIDIPIMLSGTITDASGRTLSGQTAEAFLISVSHIPLLTVGFNCALGAKQLTPHLEVLAKKSDLLISAHPNAGLPNEFGEYDESPANMASQIKVFFKEYSFEFFDSSIKNIFGLLIGLK